MLRNLSATLLSLGLLASTASLAQSATTNDVPPPPPPHEGMPHMGPGPHGPGFGMRGMLGHSPETVPNSPFSATFTSTAKKENRQGKAVERSGTRTVYRDSLGRVREDITLPRPHCASASVIGDMDSAAPAASTVPLVRTIIIDPVASTITRLDTRKKEALVETLPSGFFRRVLATENAPLRHHEHGGDENATELGSRTFAGVVAQGRQVSHTRPAPDGEAAHTVTRETWFSPDMKLQVSETETSPRGTHTEVLTTISKAEPTASLFKVPDGYTVKQAVDRPFRHRSLHEGGLRMHPDGMDGSSEPPLPPPAM